MFFFSSVAELVIYTNPPLSVAIVSQVLICTMNCGNEGGQVR